MSPLSFEGRRKQSPACSPGESQRSPQIEAKMKEIEFK